MYRPLEDFTEQHKQKQSSLLFITIYCATANPVQVIIAETEQGRGILGVVDGSFPRGKD